MWKEPQLEQLKSGILQADIISFDVFDTLIVRMTNTPEDVFTLLEKKTGIRGLANWRQRCQMMASQEVEETEQKAHADLDDTYEYLAKNHGSIVDWEQVKQEEIAIEKQVLRKNDEIYEIYQYAKSLGKRIIVTSDMYLDKSTVKDLVEGCGYHDIEQYYVSATENHTKFRGDIYHYIAEQEKVKPNTILHIGDNENSDVRLAREAGWNAFLYIRNEIPNETKIENMGIFDLGVGRYVQTGEFWHDLGAYVGGPLYVGIVKWLKEMRKANPNRPCYLLARDGYNLFQLSEKQEWIGCQYMYTSRRALTLAGITELNEETLRILPPYTLGQTIGEVVHYIALEGVTEEQVQSLGFAGLDAKINTVDDMKKVKKLYLMNEALFLKRCEKERNNAKNYFEKIGLLQNDSIIFDCGWNGSSQYLLNRVLTNIGYSKENRFVYVGILDTVKSRRQLKNTEYDTYLFDIDKNKRIQQELNSVVALLELFFGAPSESLFQYGEDELIFETIGNDENYKKNVCQGIIDFVTVAEPMYDAFGIREEAKSTLAGFMRLINYPSEKEAVTIGDIPEVDGFVVQKDTKKYLARLDYDTYMKNPNIEIYWKKGLLSRPDLDPRLKNILVAKEKSTEDECVNCQQDYRTLRRTYGKKVADYLICQTQEETTDAYQNWIREEEPAVWTTEKISPSTMFSIVIPVYNVLRQQLEECIESVLGQTYHNYELILVDDCSTWDEVRDVLRKYEKRDRVKVIYRKENGHISECTNTGINATKGDYIVFSDCDDVLSEHALYEMAVAINKDPELDFIYSDEDKLSEDGTKRHMPFFKPDWSPDTFMSLMYTNHLGVYRADIVKQVGGLRTQYNGTQDYDFTFRFMEHSSNERVGHIPKVLYYWRERGESIASNPEAKPYALEVMRQMKEEMLARRGIDAEVEYVPDMYQYRVVYHAPKDALTSIIIPSKDNPETLMRCIDSVSYYTRNRYEIIVVDNGSKESNKKKIENYLKEKNAQYIYTPMEFNFSKMCNIGAAAANGEFLLFLNDDTEVFRHEWLERMVGHASQKHVGAVGAKLLYPDSNVIQHIGITNLEIGPSHSQIGFSDNDIYYFGRNKIEYNWLAVTAACLVVQKSKFEQVGGFEEELKIGYNDVDLCFKLSECGWYNVVRNDVTLYHYESLSRGTDNEDGAKRKRLLKERQRLYESHPQYNGKDPFYNVNLVPDKVNYEVRNSAPAIVYADVQKVTHYCSKYEDNYVVIIDNFDDDENEIFVRGWYSTGKPKCDNDSDVYVWLRDEQNHYVRALALKEMREDVANNLNDGTCYVGFSCYLPKEEFLTGWDKYQVGVQVRKNSVFGWKLKWTDSIMYNEENRNE